MKLSEFNLVDKNAAKTFLLSCCHGERWSDKVINARPYPSKSQLLDSAKVFWMGVDESEALIAFSHHPKIGDMRVLRNKYAKQANAEQGQVKEASDKILHDLMNQNENYEDKFGFIFIVFASGKSAEQMLALLKERINNTRSQEIQNAIIEQGKILVNRISKSITN